MPKKKARSRAAIEAIFDAIAKRFETKYPEIIIARHIKRSPWAPRNWPARGIPMKRWPLMSKLSGLSLSEIEAAHIVTEG